MTELFKDDRYTAEANTIATEVGEALKPVIKKYRDKYSLIHLEHIILCEASIQCACARLDKQTKRAKKRGKEDV